MIVWQVLDTPCYPARWKVTFFFNGRDAGCNDVSNFFRNKEDAEREAARRNGHK